MWVISTTRTPVSGKSGVVMGVSVQSVFGRRQVSELPVKVKHGKRREKPARQRSNA
jgi:hypothetical protein